MTVEAPEYLDDAIREAAHEVQRASREADGTPPFSEQVALRWSPGARPVDGEHHLVARDAEGYVAGYAYLDPTGTAELAVLPDLRRRGHGGGMLGALAELAAEGSGDGLRVWSHGDHPGARGLATAAGFHVVRELLQLRRELDGDPAPDGVTLPTGVTVRAFRPGEDDDSWLALNARAFATHPEQGTWRQPELDDRKASDWFDPEGFLVAERDGEMIGYHWTKIADGEGEVYVLGIDPRAQGGGLGGALTLAGLRHLHARGVPAVSLYVEADNAAALAVYRRLKFGPWHADVMYAED